MKFGLAFSGGKDSWACLYLAQAQWKSIEVIWVNTGKSYPETLEMVEKARELCPNFHEVRTDQATQNALEGIPSDLVPVNYTSVGQAISGRQSIKVQSYLECCYQNISRPLHHKAQQLGITHLVRGQRMKEEQKGAARHGQKVYGIIYLHPIENWSAEEVMEYLRGKMEVPEHFRLSHSSLDCYDCSAFWKHSTDRMAWAKEHHPELAKKHRERLEMLKESFEGPTRELSKVMENGSGL